MDGVPHPAFPTRPPFFFSRTSRIPFRYVDRGPFAVPSSGNGKVCWNLSDHDPRRQWSSNVITALSYKAKNRLMVFLGCGLHLTDEERLRDPVESPVLIPCKNIECNLFREEYPFVSTWSPPESLFPSDHVARFVRLRRACAAPRPAPCMCLIKRGSSNGNVEKRYRGMFHKHS